MIKIKNRTSCTRPKNAASIMNDWKSIKNRLPSMHGSALLDGTVRIGEVKDQLDRASTSIPLNIAEGNGKYAPKDRCRFFDIAHGSALECAAGLDILVAKAKLTPEQIRPRKESL